jgi:hypothetical protein
MTNSDEDFAKKITTYLDQGAAGLKAGTAFRLQRAREAALARVGDPKRVPAPGLARSYALAGSGTVGGGGRFWASGKLWLGIVLIVIASLAYQQWQAWQQQLDIVETDAAILSSDLPIDAYLDRGFQAWLKHVGDD